MEAPHTCTTCGKVYKSKTNLARHTRVHTGERPYTCSICQRAFIENSSLKRHMRTHSEETPYKCRACKQSFKSKLALTKHLRMHTSEGSYPCLSCDKSFTQRTDLSKHFVTAHSVKTLYRCSICNEYVSNLLRHSGSHKFQTKPEQLANVPNFNDPQSEHHKMTSRGPSNTAKSEIPTGKCSSLNDSNMIGLHNEDNPYVIHIKTEEEDRD